jgi:hypothetical protein
MFIKNGQLIISDSVSVTTTNFAGVLSSADDTVQEALDTLDDHLHSAQTLTADGITPASGTLTVTGLIIADYNVPLAGTTTGTTFDIDLAGTLTNHTVLTGQSTLVDINVTNNGKNMGSLGIYSQSTLAGGTALYLNGSFMYATCSGGTANYAYGTENWVESSGGTVDVGYGVSQWISNSSGTFNTAYGFSSDIDGTITTVYGFYLDADDVTGTVWGIYCSGDDKSHLDGNLNLGAGAAYLNFGGTDGSSGYGVRDNSGVMEHKHSGGAWNRNNALVDRGDPTAVDYAVGALTTDGNWNDLDLSSIVPAGAVAVKLLATIQDDAVGNKVDFRENGNSNAYNLESPKTIVAGTDHTYSLTVFCDSSRVIEYRASNTTWTKINLTVQGWYI